MRRRLLIIVAVVTVAVAAIVGIAQASSGGISHPQTLRLLQTNSHDTIVDNPPKGAFSVADLDVFTGPLVWASSHAHAGTIDGQCLVITIQNSGRQECQITLLLHAGAVTLSGPFFGNTLTAQMAVTGGTGAYRNVRGQAAFTIAPSGKQSKITLTLLP
jgi:hypothetical protein